MRNNIGCLIDSMDSALSSSSRYYQRAWYVAIFSFEEPQDGSIGSTQFFDSSFYWLKNVAVDGKNAVAMSFPAGLNTQSAPKFDSQTNECYQQF